MTDLLTSKVQLLGILVGNMVRIFLLFWGPLQLANKFCNQILCVSTRLGQLNDKLLAIQPLMSPLYTQIHPEILRYSALSVIPTIQVLLNDAATL